MIKSKAYCTFQILLPDYFYYKIRKTLSMRAVVMNAVYVRVGIMKAIGTKAVGIKDFWMCVVGMTSVLIKQLLRKLPV